MNDLWWVILGIVAIGVLLLWVFHVPPFRGRNKG